MAKAPARKPRANSTAKLPSAPRVSRLQEQLRDSEARLQIAENRARARVVSRLAGWDAARSDRRRRDRFVTGSGDYHLDAYDRQRLVAASREMMRNNPLYRALVVRLVDLVVGAGMRPQAATDDRAWNEQAERAFDAWAHSFVDARGRMTWSMLQRHVCTEAFVAGDVLPIKGRTPVVQVVESERIVSPLGASMTPTATPNGAGAEPFVFDGVEMTPQGLALRYHISDWQGGTAATGGGSLNNTTTPIGARDATLLAVVDRPSQTRGAPMLAACMTAFADLQEYLEAHRMSAKVQAFFALIWKSQNAGADRMGLTTGYSQSATSDRTLSETEIENGAVVHIGPNDTVEALRSNAPSALADPFVRQCMTEICASVGVPVNYAMLAFEQMNFSSARAALITAMDGFQHWRNWFAAGFMAPVWRWRIAQMIREGQLPWNDQWARVHFTRPKFGWVDPVKEVQGYRDAVHAGLMSPQDAVSQFSGGDHRDVLRQRAAYLEECGEMGLEPPGMLAAPPEAPPESNRANGAPEDDGAPKPKEVPGAPTADG